MPKNTAKKKNYPPKKAPGVVSVEKEIETVVVKTTDKAPKKSLNFAALWDTVKPPVILTTICVITCALLVFAYNITYVDYTGVITDKLRAGCEEVMGEGEYEMLTDLTVEGVTSIIIDKENKNCAFEITADGYAKGGLHLLIGIDKAGAVSGINVLSIGETPGLGTKVKDSKYLDKFKGINSTEVDVDNITGATYSSKGMKKAVALAIETYQNQKEAIFSE